MRFPVWLGLALVVFVSVAPPACGDETAVKQMVNDYARAFNAQQIDQVMSFWTESAIHIDRDTGERTEGRDAIRQDIAESFEQRPGTRIFGRIERVRLIRPDVASVDGEVTISVPEEAATVNVFSAILVNQNEKWMIEELEEVALPQPASSFDALKELEWLVGTWVDEADDARIDTVFRWTANQAFLLRSFAVQAADGIAEQGTQIIGWDPRSGEIRSWSFNSDGSFGDGIWSKNGNDWLIKSSQTLADGKAASGTYVLSRVNDDEMTLQLIGHEIEGEPQPSSLTVTVARVDATDPTSTQNTAAE